MIRHFLKKWLRFLNIGLALFSLCFVPACFAAIESTAHSIAPGIQYRQEITNSRSPLIINILRIDLKTKGVRLQMGQARDFVSISGPYQGREVIHSMAVRHHAIAAVNADFFPFTGDPLGIAIRDSELISEPSGYRACLGITKNNRILLDVLTTIGAFTSADGSKCTIDGINRVPHNGDTIILTPTFTESPKADKNGYIVQMTDMTLPVKLSRSAQGTVASIAPVAAGERIPQTPDGSVQLVALGDPANRITQICKRGDKASLRFDVVSNSAPLIKGHYDTNPQTPQILSPISSHFIWQHVTQAVGGGPMLIKNGEIALDGEAEGFSKSDFIDKRHPRTAAGVDNNGMLLLVTVDGRSKESQGASLEEMAAIMKRLGAVQAMNFDGGGSTTMVVDGLVVNAPSDGQERPVADGLLVMSNAVAAAPSRSYSLAINKEICSGNIVVHAGDQLHFQVVDAGKRNVESRKVVWGTEDGFGFVSQSGVFTGSHQGRGVVAAYVEGMKIQVSVQVVGASAPPDSTASQKDPDTPNSKNLFSPLPW